MEIMCIIILHNDPNLFPYKNCFSFNLDVLKCSSFSNWVGGGGNSFKIKLLGIRNVSCTMNYYDFIVLIIY